MTEIATTTDIATVQNVISIASSLNLRQWATTAAILVLGLLLIRLVMRLLNKALESSKFISPTLHAMIRTMTRILLYVILILTVASSMGIPITTFVALLSVAGIAVSLAVQGILSNFAGGIIILIGKPFNVGDWIELDSIGGTVREIGILNTRLLSGDGKYIIVPNSSLYTSVVTNATVNGRRRIDLTVSASYDNSPEEVRAAVMDAIHSLPAILQDPEPIVQLDSYGDSAIAYVIRAWTLSSDWFTTRYALNEKLYTVFRKHHVVMTYPHLNVHLDPDRLSGAK